MFCPSQPTVNCNFQFSSFPVFHLYYNLPYKPLFPDRIAGIFKPYLPHPSLMLRYRRCKIGFSLHPIRMTGVFRHLRGGRGAHIRRVLCVLGSVLGPNSGKSSDPTWT